MFLGEGRYSAKLLKSLQEMKTQPWLPRFSDTEFNERSFNDSIFLHFYINYILTYIPPYIHSTFYAYVSLTLSQELLTTSVIKLNYIFDNFLPTYFINLIWTTGADFFPSIPPRNSILNWNEILKRLTMWRKAMGRTRNLSSFSLLPPMINCPSSFPTCSVSMEKLMELLETLAKNDVFFFFSFFSHYIVVHCTYKR